MAKRIVYKKRYRIDDCLDIVSERKETYSSSSSNKFGFGKYKGRLISDIVTEDYDYICWCIENMPRMKDKLSLILSYGAKKKGLARCVQELLAKGFTYNKERNRYEKFYKQTY